MERRARQAKLIRNSALREAVIDRLEHGWSPEQIAGRLRIEPDAPARLLFDALPDAVHPYISARDAGEGVV